jgi:hypothetical protein
MSMVLRLLANQVRAASPLMVIMVLFILPLGYRVFMKQMKKEI